MCKRAYLKRHKNRVWYLSFTIYRHFHVLSIISPLRLLKDDESKQVGYLLYKEIRQQKETYLQRTNRKNLKDSLILNGKNTTSNYPFELISTSILTDEIGHS